MLSTHVATPRVFVYPSFSSFCNINDKPKELSGKPPRLLILPNHNLRRLLMTKQSKFTFLETHTKVKVPSSSGQHSRISNLLPRGKKESFNIIIFILIPAPFANGHQNAIVYFPHLLLLQAFYLLLPAFSFLSPASIVQFTSGSS